MQKLITVAFAALCLVGTSSLTLADDAMKSEKGNMKGEMKAEKEAAKGEMKGKKSEMKGKTKTHKDTIKAKRHQTKEKTKAHKDGAKVRETKGAAQSMKQDMRAAVPAAPAPTAAP